MSCRRLHVPRISSARPGLTKWARFAIALLLFMAWSIDGRAQDNPEPAEPTPDKWELPHYDQGFVLVSSPDSASLPFRLRLNHVSQFRYTNTLAVHKTYLDHLGRERPVLRRN